jgi:hypothetical protein
MYQYCSSILKMEAAGFSGMLLIPIYQSAQCKIPENSQLHVHLLENSNYDKSEWSYPDY